MRPAVGRRKPVTMANSVVLPAPFGPISAVMRPASAVNDAPSTASRPPKRFDTASTRRSGSAMGTLRCDDPRPRPAQAGEQAGYAAWRERHHQDQHGAVDDEIEAGRIAGDELGHLAQRLDHQRAQQWTDRGADAADDGGKQRLDRDPRPVRDTGIDE